MIDQHSAANRQPIVTTEPTGIPAELRAEPRWVVARVDKVPLCARDVARKARRTDASTWADFETAERVLQQDSDLRLGFVLGDGFTGVDLDDCRNPETEVVDQWAAEIVDRLDRYSEPSVSGTGIHIICKGRLPAGRRRNGLVEMYDSARYFIVTGTGNGEAVAERTQALAALHADVFPDRTLSTRGVVAAPVASDGIPDDEILERIRASAQRSMFDQLCGGDWAEAGYFSPSEADLAFCSILAHWTDDGSQIDRLFRLSGLCRNKWTERPDYRDRTIALAIARVGCRGVASRTTQQPADVEGAAPPKHPKSHASRLVRLVKDAPGVVLFHTPDNTEYVTIANKTLRIKSNEFKRWLRQQSFNETQRALSGAAVQDAVDTLSGFALYEGPTHDVYTRVANSGDVVYLDLGGDVAEITGHGWQVLTHSPVRFVRSPGFMPLPKPATSTEDLSTLLKTFLNVRDDSDLRLIVGWLVGTLRGKKTFPVLSVSGEQGSAKSSACRYLRRLIDPNAADTRLPAKDQRDLMIAARNRYIIAFDNLTRLDDTLTNGLCGLATGAGTATRALCTDTDEIIIHVARPILLNGINDVAKRPDLLDRTIQVSLDAIPDHARKTDAEVEEAFTRAQPQILGRLLDAVACALKHEPTTRLARKPRLADFATVVTAAEPALGWKTGSFLELLRDNRRSAVEGLLDGDMVAAALEKLTLPWTGTATKLRRRLLKSLEMADLESFPKTPKAMGKALRELAPALRQAGIDVEFRKGHDRTIEIRRRGSQHHH